MVRKVLLHIYIHIYIYLCLDVFMGFCRKQVKRTSLHSACLLPEADRRWFPGLPAEMKECRLALSCFIDLLVIPVRTAAGKVNKEWHCVCTCKARDSLMCMHYSRVTKAKSIWP